MSRHKTKQRVMAMVLSAIIVVGMMPVSALAETGTFPIGVSGEITALEALGADIATQSVLLGTSEADLKLPDTLTATIRLTALEKGPVLDSGETDAELDSADTVSGSSTDVDEIDDSATGEESETTSPSDAGETEDRFEVEPTEKTVDSVDEIIIPLPVTWVSSPEYDGEVVDTYIFLPKLTEGLVLASGVETPVITVTVVAATITTGTVKAFDELPDNIRWQNTTTPVFPETVGGMGMGEATEIPVKWETEQEYDAEYPVLGLYVFTAVLGEGYSVADDIELPRITVYIPQTGHVIRTRMAGSGTTDSPLKITTAAQLVEIATLVNARENGLELFLFNDVGAKVSLKLQNDIDLSAYSKGKGWMPIGSASNQFKGTFDGGGNRIAGLYINRNENFQGLFGCVGSGGTIRNIGVENVNITGGNYVGGVAGYINGMAENCYITGTVSGTIGIGGVVGHVYSGTVQNCYSTSTVSGTANVGGVAGYAYNGTMKNCAALNPSISGSTNVGRVVGEQDNGTLTGNYAFSGMTVNGGTVSDGTAANKNGAGKTSADLQTSGGFPTALITTPWTYEEGKLPGFDASIAMPAHIIDISGEYFNGAGTSENPYQISTPAQLAKLSELVRIEDDDTRNAYNTKHYKLTSDIDLSVYNANNIDFNSGKGWIPIGGYFPSILRAFSGVFDGGGYHIKGLYLNDSNYYAGGLFGVITNGTVKNLGIVDAYIRAGYDVGGISAMMSTSSTVENCFITGEISGKNSVGGIVGDINGTTSSVINSYSAATVTGVNEVGGIIGRSNMGNAVNSYVTGMVTGTNKVGGVVGDFYGVSGSKVQNCVALNPSISGSSEVSRVVGSRGGTGVISGNYAYSGMKVTMGGVVQTITDGAANNINGLTKTADELQAISGFPGGFGSAPWTYTEKMLPGLRGKTVDMSLHLLPTDTSPFGGGDGTNEAQAYEISTAAQLAKLSELVRSEDDDTRNAYNTKHYKLTSDIDLSVYNTNNIDFNSGKGWIPIGGYFPSILRAFSGIFDGGGYRIKGLYLNDSNYYAGGLFGVISNGTVKNLGIVDAYIRAGYNVGGISAMMSTSSTVKNCFITGEISGKNSVGGIVGDINGTTSSVINSYSAATVTGENEVGGIIGRSNMGNAVNSYVTGMVTGTSKVGGVVGDFYGVSGSKVQNCVALNPSVSGSSEVSRVVGSRGGTGVISGNYAYSGMKVNGTTATGGTMGNINGADMSITQANDASFWTTAYNWNTSAWDASVWTITDYKLPILTGFPVGTQSGDGGVYLTERNIVNAIISSDNLIYNGKQQTPTFTFDGAVLVEDIDYTISITSMDGTGTSAGTNVGEVTITITGKGNFKGTKTGVTYTIEPKTLTADMLMVTGGPFTYTGTPHTLDVTVTDGIFLKLGTDYDVTYSDNTSAGDASVSVTGKDTYTGTVSKIFTIRKATAPTITWPTATRIAYGSPLSASALAGGSTEYGSFAWSTPETIPTVTNSGYEVLFTPSTATVNNYEAISPATQTVQIAVTAKSISRFTVDAIDPVTYTGVAQTPVVVVKDGVTTLTSGTDYDVTYSDNTHAGTAAVAIEGKGNYIGTVSKNFTIKKRPVTVKADDKSMTRGGTLPTFTYTVDGQLSGETALARVTALTCVANGKTAGSYPITIDLAGIRYTANYEAANPAFVSGTLTVNHSPSSGSGGDSSFGSHTETTAPQKQPDQPVISETSVTATVGQNGTASANVSDKAITDAVHKAQEESKKLGKTANGIGIALNVNLPQGTSSLSLPLSQNALQSLVNAGVTSLTINSGIASLSLDLEALKEIQNQGAGRLTITIKPVQNLSSGARAMIGTRPVYDVTISYINDGKTVTITSLGKGCATLSFPYTPGRNEAEGYLFGVYVDDKGNATRIPHSAYDANRGSVIFTTTHFSLYGIGYTAPTEKFTDISSRWDKESIDYVVGRGLLSGTSDTAFAPNTAMSRGALATALGRLAGVDIKAYTTSSFTDVAADKYYAPYVEWAYKKGIVSGIGNGKFAPDRAVTREEMTVIFANYAKATGYNLPVTREATAYADASSIGSVYKMEVTAMQQAGIMMGGTNNKFNPKASATRAEVAAMLHRYIKLTIDPATAQGWALNDIGKYLYYKDGKPFTGWQTIGGIRYFFNTNGTLQTGWVKDGDTWRFCDGNRALIGWWNIGDDSNKKRYYFDRNAAMVSGKWFQVEGKWYYFCADGSLAKNTTIDGHEVDDNGARKNK